MVGGQGHVQGRIRRWQEQFADWRGVVPFLRFSLYTYVVRGLEGDCRNIFHEGLVCGSLRAVLEQQFKATFVVRRYVSKGANLKLDKFYICTKNIVFEWDS